MNTKIRVRTDLEHSRELWISVYGKMSELEELSEATAEAKGG